MTKLLKRLSPLTSQLTAGRIDIPSFPLIILSVLGILIGGWLAAENPAGWGVDFNQFYAASHLAGTGHLYNWDALRKLEAQHGAEVRTGRLPVVSFGMKLLGWLPYRIAHRAWFAICLAALLLAVVIWPGSDKRVMLTALAWSTPAVLLLLFGQDTPLWLLFFAIAVSLLAKQRQFSAGVAFAFCLCKFHLALGIPVLLLAERKWKALASGAVTVVVLLAACFLIEGPNWPQRYLEMVNHPFFSPAHERMPNIRGLASWFPSRNLIELASALLVLILLWFVSRRYTTGPGIGVAGAAAAAAGLLLGRHAYANDCTLLIPMAVVVLQESVMPLMMKIWAVLLLTPVPTLLLASKRPYLGQIAFVGFVLVALALLCRKAPAEAMPADEPRQKVTKLALP